MINRLRYLNLLMVLPDDRILLKRTLPRWGSTNYVPWSCTMERFLGDKQLPLVETNILLRKYFGVATNLMEDGTTVGIRQLDSIFSLQGKEVIPVIVKAKTHLSFQAEVHDEFKALFFNKFLDEVTEFSVHPSISQTNGKLPQHTQVCVHVARTVHERGLFG